jgi:hypothetical protein
MVGATPSASLEQALALLDEALVQAEAGCWERVAELDARCRDASQAVVQGIAGDDPGPLADGLKRLRDRHHRLLELAEAQRERLAEARRTSARGRRGARAYEDNA